MEKTKLQVTAEEISEELIRLKRENFAKVRTFNAEEMLDHIKRFTVSANRKSQTAENQAQGSGSYNSDIASFNYLGRLEI